MGDKKDLKGIASRVTAIRREQKLTRPQMAEALKISYTAYTKYERALNLPSFKSQVILSEKFDISLDWLLLNKGLMHLSDIEKASRENQMLKQEQEKLAELKKQEEIKKQKKELNKEPVLSPDAVMVTAPDIKELLRYMEDNPLFKHQLLTYFYRFKQGKPGDQEPEESPFE
jgi:transcriptional regulator with XRE-family HTH domain